MMMMMMMMMVMMAMMMMIAALLQIWLFATDIHAGGWLRYLCKYLTQNRNRAGLATGSPIWQESSDRPKLADMQPPSPPLFHPFHPSPPPFHPKTPSFPTHVPMTPLMWERSQEISRSQKERRCRMILRWLQHSCVELSWVTRLPPWGLLRHRSRRFKSVQQGSLIPSTGFTSGLKLFDAEGKGQMGCWWMGPIKGE